MTIDKLLNGIKTKWAATGALTTAFASNGTDGPYRDIAEGSPAMPYCVLEVGSFAPLTDAYANAISAEVTLTFKVVGNGNNATAANVALILAAFDHATLTLTGATNIGMYRLSEPWPMKLPSDQFGSDVWQWSIPYIYQIQ
jgi:hypothetical protein